MTKTTAPVQSLVDEVLAELNQSAVSHRELNTSNYDHHDICQLNDWGVDACTALEKAADLIRQQRAELTSIEAMVRMLEENEWAEHVGQLGGPIAQRLEREITRLHNEQQAASVAVPDELRVKAGKFVISRRQAAEFDRAAESELEGDDADEAQACAVQAFFHEEAAALVEQLLAALAAAPTPPAKETADYLDGLIDRLNEAQQDINLVANETMSQPLCSASALLDEVEAALRRYTAPPAQQSHAVIDVLEEHAKRRHQWLDAYEEYGLDNAVIDEAALLLMEVVGIPVPADIDFSEWLSEEDRNMGRRAALVTASSMILAEIEFMDREAAPGDTAAPEQAEQDAVKVPRELLRRLNIADHHHRMSYVNGDEENGMRYAAIFDGALDDLYALLEGGAA